MFVKAEHIPAIQRRVNQLYTQRYGGSFQRIPRPVLDGLVSSLLSGEVQVTTDTPADWPLSVVVPLTREVVAESTEVKQFEG